MKELRGQVENFLRISKFQNLVIYIGERVIYCVTVRFLPLNVFVAGNYV